MATETVTSEIDFCVSSMGFFNINTLDHKKMLKNISLVENTALSQRDRLGFLRRLKGTKMATSNLCVSPPVFRDVVFLDERGSDAA